LTGDRRVIVTTGSRDRLWPLCRALSTWLALKEVDMVIIVDWGSKIPIRDAVDFLDDPRVRIYRAEGQSHWQNSKCHNLEVRIASGGGLLGLQCNDVILLRLDNDVLVRPDFLRLHPLRGDDFYAGNWRTVPPLVSDKRNLSGTLLVDPKDVLAINGYNERLVHYGREDDDLYFRMSVNGLVWREVDVVALEHISHSDKKRYENLSIGDAMTSRRDPRADLIDMSKKIIVERPWTMDDRMTEWSCREVAERYWKCNEIT